MAGEIRMTLSEATAVLKIDDMIDGEWLDMAGLDEQEAEAWVNMVLAAKECVRNMQRWRKHA